MEFHFLHCALIHRSAWKKNSANFALTEFSEVRLARYRKIERHRAAMFAKRPRPDTKATRRKPDDNTLRGGVPREVRR